MAKRITFLIVLLVLGAASLSAQSWRQLQNQADESFEKGLYEQAARTYEQAWEKKKKKTELIHKAGEAYYLVPNYRKAAEAYQNVVDDRENYPLAGLKYARSLKQDGQYDRSIAAFRAFADGYVGEGKSILEDIIRVEVEGANLGKALPAQADPDLELTHLEGGINTAEQELAPLPVSDDLMFFSAVLGDKARIFQARRTSGGWSKDGTPNNFPVIQNGQYCHGALSDDGSRLYFTICEDGKFGNLSTRCEIFVIQRQGNGWSQPQRLPDYINTQGVTATHPSVVVRGDVEILYFASNRNGGRGGMDIWYSTRSLRSPGAEFSQPVNLGPTINTMGDEMTPYYDGNEGALFFASNGHPSMGGFDIFRSSGDLVNWTSPENYGVPYNSSADDYYFVKNTMGSGGFFTSNRVFAGEKLTTKDDDIYEFRSKPRDITLEGNAFDQASGEILANYTVALFEVRDDGSEVNLISQDYNTAEGYAFQILPNRTFRVEISSPGYVTADYQFMTNDPTAVAYGQPLFLRPLREEGPPQEDPTQVVEDPTPPVVEDPANLPPTEKPMLPANEEIGTGGSASYTLRATAPYDQFEYMASAPRYQGTYYKVQMAALKRFDANDSRYSRVRDLGSLESEYILSKNLYRALLGNFFTNEEAKEALSRVQSSGFSGAFLVRYIDGVRFGRVNLR